MNLDSYMNVTHHFSDGLYTKEIPIPKDYMVIQHRHNYSHLSILAKGRVLVHVDDEVKEVVGPACLEIKKGAFHSIKALEDSLWYCIHATDETDLNNMEDVLVKKGD